MKLNTRTLLDLTEKENNFLKLAQKYEELYDDWTYEELTTWEKISSKEFKEMIENLKTKIPDLIIPNRKRECKVLHKTETAWRLK